MNAVPVPAALLLLTVIVKLIGFPVATGEASAVFVMLRLGGGGGSTVMVAVAEGPAGSLFAKTVAVFVYVAALEPGGASVGACTCTVAEAPGARFPKLQVKSAAVI